MNILKVTGGFPPAEKEGGTAVVGHALSKYLKLAEHNVKVFTTNINGDGFIGNGDVWEKVDGVDVFYAKASKTFFKYFSPSMISEFKKHIAQADIVLMASVWTWYGPQIARICREAGVPYVLYPHGVRSGDRMAMQSYYKKIAWWHLFDKKMFLKANGLVAITEFEKEEMKSIGVTCPIDVIPNGVEAIPNLDNPREYLLKHYNIPINSPIVFFLGRIETIKGVDLAIESFKLVLEECSDACMVLAGPDRDNLTEKLKILAKNLNIEDKVIFTGSVRGDARSALYHSASVLLLPSITEVLAMSVLEALKTGIPVVVTDKDAFVDLIEYGACLGCDRNKEDISNAVISLLLDKQKHELMAASGKMLAEDKYSWNSVVEQTSQFCESLIEEKY